MHRPGRLRLEQGLLVLGLGVSVFLALALGAALLEAHGASDRASPTSNVNVSMAARKHVAERVVGYRLEVEFPPLEEDLVERLQYERFRVTSHVDYRDERFGTMVRRRYQVELRRERDGAWIVDGLTTPP